MLWKIGLIGIAILISISACSSRPTAQSSLATPDPGSYTDSPDPNTSTISGQNGQVEAPITSEGSGQGGTLVKLWADPPSLDPHLSTDATSASILVEVFGGLVTLDPNLEVVVDLAESYQVSNDMMTYTFSLRQNAMFHDGKPVTAHDVKWSLERATDPSTLSPTANQYLGDIVGVKDKLKGRTEDISGVSVLDKSTIQIQIDAPKSYFLSKLTYPTGFVLDRKQVENDRRWFRNPNGTGPFRMAKYDLGEELILERNENYHLGPPLLNSVRFILSGGTAMLMYENDEIHIAGVGLADLDRLLDPSNALNAELHKAPPAFDTRYIGMNVNEPPLDDPKVRQALNYAIDRKEIANIVLGDLVVPARGILPPGFPGHDSNLNFYEYNPQKAIQLLRESKYGNDLDNFPLIVLTTAGSFGANVGLDTQVIQEMWRTNLGIEIEVQQTEYALYLQDLQSRLFQMFEIGWIADYPDPENFLDILFHSESNNNHTGFNNPDVDQLLEKARLGPQEDRYDLYHQIERIILDAAPWIPLWWGGDQYILIKPNVKNYLQTPLIIPKLRYVSLDES